MNSPIRSHWWGVMTETIWGVVYRTRKVIAGLAVLGVVAPGFAAQAAEDATDSVSIGAARLLVRRGPEAAECPNAEALAAELQSLGVDGARAAAPEITVELEPNGSGFAARVTVTGESGGVRDLRADGPGCARLAADLKATLALLLDQKQQAVAAPAEVASEPEPAPPVARAKPPANQPSARSKKPRPSALHGRAELGGGAAIALVAHPTPYFDTAFWLEHPEFSLALQLFTTTSSSAELAPGAVHVLLLGGVVKACFPLFGTFRRFEGSLCFAGAVAAMRGEATDYVVTDQARYQPWYALGGAALLGGPITGNFSWKADTTVLAPLHHQSFVVGPMGTAFETPVVGALVGIRVGMSIW